MIKEITKNQLIELKFSSMYEIIKKQEELNDFLGMSFDERFEYLIQTFYDIRKHENNLALKRRAKLAYPNASINDIYYKDRNLDRDLILNLSSGSFIVNNKNIVILGPSSSGKSYLASAIANTAGIANDYRTKYLKTSTIKAAIQDLTLKEKVKLAKSYASYTLLIIDEFLTHDLDTAEMDFFLELIDSRYEKNSTIYCSLYPIEEWSIRLNNSVVGESIIERIVNGAINLKSGSLNMRKERPN